MKKLYTILLLWLSVSAFSQLPNCNSPVPYNKRAYQMLENLDKSQIPTGVLYESVFP